MEENTVTGAVTIEWTNSQGMSSRKVVYKVATLRIIRNSIREMYVEISGAKSAPIKLRLHRIAVHKKFMDEGKASIQFLDEKCTVFCSNMPTGALIGFLRILIIKISGDAEKTPTMNRAKMLMMSENKQFEDISPVTNTELSKMKQMSKASTTTPSPPQGKKRPRIVSGEDTTPKNKVFKPSRLIEGPDLLNEEQKEVLNTCLAGKNVFFTGSAGTGKSYLLRKIISALPPDSTFATASTGVAACLIGGMTLHSFAGIGSGEATLPRCYQMAEKSASAQVWRKCKHLIIDEISMVDGEFFDKLESVARHVRKTEKPFGGIQLILCGDFFQLPPVSKNSENKKRFCFQSSTWSKCIQVSFELKKVHRQKDPEFVNMLNLIRIGRVTDDLEARLLQTAKQRIEKNGILATQLCSHTKEANLINQNKLQNLEGESKIFDCQDSDKFYSAQLDQQVPAPGKLELKIGAQVMLLKNINIGLGLVNGARGVVSKFENSLPRIRFKSGEYLCKPEKWTIKTAGGNLITRSQVPLKLAWAFSIHKSQGLTLDCVEMSLSRVFEAGQAYVALSRAQSLDSLRVLDFDLGQVWANPEVLKFYKNFRRELGAPTQFIKLGVKSSGQSSRDELLKKLKSVPKKALLKPLVTIN